MATCVRVDGSGRACGGTIEDGVCEECGRAPAGKLVTTATGNAAARDPVTGTLAVGGTTARGGATGTSATGRKGNGRTSRRHTRSSTSRRQALGGGLVSLPPMPSLDPLKLVKADPESTLGRRRCPHCEARVNKAKGYCSNCGEAYDFRPKLSPGQVLAGKYEVKGAIAFGGMGWVYLGYDVALKRWVVLKGLLNANDAEAMAAAVAERQFLADIKHGRIVSIYDFVDLGTESYMVLEYVGGRTLESLREERGPLPPEEAMAYVLGVLPAFSYLHSRNYVYCDFKPGNLMLEGDDVKLIDLGAVRRIGDPDGSIFATDGYAAKEANDDPDARSDLYTVGRTLAVLLMDFLWKQGVERDPATGTTATTRRMVAAYKDALPSADEQPVLAADEALRRFLLRACHDDPDQRFQSADEMELQLFGVLRQAVARKSGPRPAESKAFLGDGLVSPDDVAGMASPLGRTLPALRVDPSDPAAAEAASAAAVSDPVARRTQLANVVTRRPKSVEARIRLGEGLLAEGTPDGDVQALRVADHVLSGDEFEWRAHWLRGKALLAAGRAPEAATAFDRCWFEMPGELAPQVALGMALEAGGDNAGAARRYAAVVTTDPAHASACAGLARVRAAMGDVAGSAAALDAIPAGHSMRGASRVALATLLTGEVARATTGAGIIAGMDAGEALGRASSALGEVGPGPARTEAEAMLMEAAARYSEKFAGAKIGPVVGASGAKEIRLGAESRWRERARTAATAAEREMLVDRANAVRPSTTF